MLTTVVAICTVLCLICAMLILSARTLFSRRRNRNRVGSTTTVGFFHPYCNAGGGGERVLYCAVRALQHKYEDVKIVVFTGDTDANPADIVSRAENRFNVRLPRPVTFVYLSCRRWVEASTYPHLTLLGQSVGSMLLGLEALTKCAPDVYVDSMGYAFTLPIFKYLGGCSVGCYVHYPTVSTDMLRRVADGQASHNNVTLIGGSRLLTSAKILYYHAFAFLYSQVGAAADVVMVNSSWTRQHILQLWNRPSVTFLVYPPCDITAFQTIPLQDEVAAGRKELSVVSVSQFRPEKDHRLQIHAFRRLLDMVNNDFGDRLRLKLIGSCRNEQDDKRVTELKSLARELGVAHAVQFLLNVSFDELKAHMRDAVVGLHTMWNEHFGIGVVECMAAGLVMLAHNSGGPRMDIVVDFDGRRTGFLASDVQGFADALKDILEMSEDERREIRSNARRSTDRFSDDIFDSTFLNLFETFLGPVPAAVGPTS